MALLPPIEFLACRVRLEAVVGHDREQNHGANNEDNPERFDRGSSTIWLRDRLPEGVDHWAAYPSLRTRSAGSGLAPSNLAQIRFPGKGRMCSAPREEQVVVPFLAVRDALETCEAAGRWTQERARTWWVDELTEETEEYESRVSGS